MARTAKNHEAKLNELLDVAQALFLEKGFENATMNDILGKARISKGALYHYFASKEDILDRLTARMSSMIIEKSRHVMDDPGIDAPERLRLLMKENRAFKLEQGTFMVFLLRTLYSDANLLLRYRLSRRMVGIQVPYFRAIIEQGNREGHFNVGNPGETASIISVTNIAFSEILVPLFLELPQKPGNADAIRRHYRALTDAITGILGSRQGSFGGDDDMEGFIQIFSGA